LGESSSQDAARVGVRETAITAASAGPSIERIGSRRFRAKPPALKFIRAVIVPAGVRARRGAEFAADYMRFWTSIDPGFRLPEGAAD